MSYLVNGDYVEHFEENVNTGKTPTPTIPTPLQNIPSEATIMDLVSTSETQNPVPTPSKSMDPTPTPPKGTSSVPTPPKVTSSVPTTPKGTSSVTTPPKVMNQVSNNIQNFNFEVMGYDHSKMDHTISMKCFPPHVLNNIEEKVRQNIKLEEDKKISEQFKTEACRFMLDPKLSKHRNEIDSELTNKLLKFCAPNY